MTEESTNNDLDEEIDELVLEAERVIQSSKETLEDFPEIDSKYRRMEEAEPTDLFA